MSGSDPLERAFTVLEIISSGERDVSMMEIVKASGFPQSSTFRLCSNLVDSGMLEYDQTSKTYRMGDRAHRFAAFMSGRKTLEKTVTPALNELARVTVETSFFVQASHGQNKMLKYVLPEVGARSLVHPGFDFPPHATAAGKAIYAFTRKPDAHALDDLAAHQPATVTDPVALEKVFETVRTRGYALNDSELDKDVFSLAAPVFLGKTVAGAMGVVGPRERLLGNASLSIDALGALLIKEADAVTRLLKH